MLLDDYSSFACCFLLQSKDETITAIKRFFELIKNQHNTVIKQFHSDQGGEFTSKKFDDLLAEKAIVRQMSAPHIHQQNGRAERLNNTILEKSESMHLHTSCPESWWEFSFETAKFMSIIGHHSDELIGVHHMKTYLAKSQMSITLKPLDVLHGFIHLKNHIKIS